MPVLEATAKSGRENVSFKLKQADIVGGMLMDMDISLGSFAGAAGSRVLQFSWDDVENVMFM